MIKPKTFADKRNANLNKLELLLGISDNTDECYLMEICYDDAIQTFLELTNRNENQIHLKHTSIILDLAIHKYKSLKSNQELISKAGIKSISEGGVSITYNTTLTDTETILFNLESSFLPIVYEMNLLTDISIGPVTIEREATTPTTIL